MNYIITESKLDNIIDNFITTQFGKLHHQLDGDKFTLVNDNGDPIFIVILTDYGQGYYAYVLDEDYVSAINMFSMVGFKDIQSALSRWLYKHYNLPVKESRITTFSRGEEEYAY